MSKPPTSCSLEVVDATGLTDADWAEVNRLKAANDAGGAEAFLAALIALEQKADRACKAQHHDGIAGRRHQAVPIELKTYRNMLNAFSTDRISEVIKEALSEKLLRKLWSPGMIKWNSRNHVKPRK
jgi:hypothetical protein